MTLKDGLRILERHQYCCQFCALDCMAKFENSMVMSVDFIVPRGRGRKKTASNRVIARRPYNTLKGWREFKSFEEAKAHVLNRREEVHEKWEARMAQLRAKTARA